MQSNAAYFEWAVQASDLADLVAGPAIEMRLCVVAQAHPVDSALGTSQPTARREAANHRALSMRAWSFTYVCICSLLASGEAWKFQSCSSPSQA